MTIDEAIEHAKQVAKENYTVGMLCHANPNDEKLDECIACAKEHEQLAEWLEELKQYKEAGEQGVFVKIKCHCKDCKHWKDEFVGCTDHVKLCGIGRYMVGENGYCLYAEQALKDMESER